MAKLHLIGNAHIDPVWLWRWQDGFSEVLATWRSALDRMNDFPDFKFTSACAVYYQWVEKPKTYCLQHEVLGTPIIVFNPHT